MTRNAAASGLVRRNAPAPDEQIRGWTVRDSLELYQVNSWGDGYFSINDRGRVQVTPQGPQGPVVDLLDLVQELDRRGLRAPLLIRFTDILASRIERISSCFKKAIEEQGYKGRYRGVYPIKVNQQRHVVEEIVHYGRAHHIGLEAGSKPELLVALALLDNPEALITCNGYKDYAYVETALLAQKLGRRPFIVIDRFHELDLILRASRALGIRPNIGVRVKLSTKGAGKWVDSSGDRSKFGLSSTEIVEVVDKLREENLLDCLQLLHYHIGSQITAIRAHKDALREATRFFTGLHELGAPIRYVDVGGGLGVDYDGSQTNFHSSMNYTTQEYANDVVFALQEACERAKLPHPDIITEAGRATTAHHSVLILNVLGVSRVVAGVPPEKVAETDPKVLRSLYEVWETVSRKTLLEAFHDALELKEEATSLFDLGFLDLKARARVERLFWSVCEKILNVVRDLEYIPEELEGIERALSDLYFCNFSVFQSAPDHWAVKQLFPTMPIHRLNEKPTRSGILADLTCDSDGKVDQFIDLRDVKDTLELHPYTGEPYYLGMFLVGAYQEILGDLHNLFGDTHAIHVKLSQNGSYTLEHVVEGDAVADVLHYVQYDKPTLVEKVRQATEASLREGRITFEESALLRKRFEQGLAGYTYLDLE
jgi:arginine decarboxylase